jgi:hypothetical protein
MFMSQPPSFADLMERLSNDEQELKMRGKLHERHQSRKMSWHKRVVSGKIK